MKKHFLIFLSSIVFVVLFYEQEIGLNLSLFSLFLLVISFVQKKELLKDKRAILLALGTIVSAVSNAWLFSFTTFLATISTLFVFRYYVVDSRLKLVTQVMLFFSNCVLFLPQVFKIEQWLEVKKGGSHQMFLKLFSYFILPIAIVLVFTIIYISSSDWLYDWYMRYELDINGFIIFVFMLGFYLSFVFWQDRVYPFIKANDQKLNSNFSNAKRNDESNTNHFFPDHYKLMSGTITIFALNVMLFFFIVIFNIEHLTNVQRNTEWYSEHIHEQIYLIIVSIFLAMMVILYFFSGKLNFIEKNNKLIVSTKLWIALNGLLLLSAFYQNTLYVAHLGLTYKRLGVYLFLITCIAGLWFCYQKVHHKKTNFYLIDNMSWTIYIVLVFCSLFNWSSIITKYNLTKKTVDYSYLEYLVGNEKYLIQHYQSIHKAIPSHIYYKVQYEKNQKLFSSQLYYK